MCEKCVKEDTPERTMCLDTGAYMANYKGCAQCGGLAFPDESNKEVDEEELSERVTFQHACPKCGHTISVHQYSMEVVDGRQEYEMDCMLCGTASDSRDVFPR